jgi:hypothetical protein
MHPPELAFFPALNPAAVFPLAEEWTQRARYPIAVFLAPVVFEHRAKLPNLVFEEIDPPPLPKSRQLTIDSNKIAMIIS